MPVHFSRTGLVVDGRGFWFGLASFADSVARGIGQVMLQNNSYAGLLFTIGIFLNSALFGVAALVGCAVSTGAAIGLGVDRSLVRAGLFGFNGALVAIALLFFLQPAPLTWACVILAAACSTIVMAAMISLLGAWKIPALTAPFVFTSLCFFLATARFGRLESTHLLPTAGLPQEVTVEGVVTATTIGEGLFTGIAQVFFQESVPTGIVFALGLLAGSWRACGAAVAGSLSGLLVAWGMGAGEPAIRAGAFGFNSALVAIALGATFFAPSRISMGYALVGVMVTPFVYAAVSAAFEPLGMPALTLPFVLVTWTFLFSGKVAENLSPDKA